MKLHIDGKEATYVAIEASKRDPIRVEPAERVPADKAPGPQAAVAASTDGRKPPPRLRKPSPGNDQCLAPTGDWKATAHDCGKHSATPVGCKSSSRKSPPGSTTATPTTPRPTGNSP